MPGFGVSGPRRDYRSYGPTLEGQSGLADLTGYDGEAPLRMGCSYPDMVGGVTAAFAILAALRAAEPDRPGRPDRAAWQQAAAALTGIAVARWTLTKQPSGRLGNGHPLGSCRMAYHRGSGSVGGDRRARRRGVGPARPADRAGADRTRRPARPGAPRSTPPSPAGRPDRRRRDRAAPSGAGRRGLSGADGPELSAIPTWPRVTSSWRSTTRASASSARPGRRGACPARRQRATRPRRVSATTPTRSSPSWAIRRRRSPAPSRWSANMTFPTGGRGRERP